MTIEEGGLFREAAFWFYITIRSGERDAEVNMVGLLVSGLLALGVIFGIKILLKYLYGYDCRGRNRWGHTPYENEDY